MVNCIEKTPKGEHKKGRKGAVLAGVAAAVVLCGYLGLCAWAGGRDAILPHVSISGLDVSGMTQDQAADALKNALAEESGDPITLNISCEGWSGQLSAARPGRGPGGHRPGGHAGRGGPLPVPWRPVSGPSTGGGQPRWSWPFRTSSPP